MARPKRERKLTKRALVAQQQSELDLGEDPLLAGSDDVDDDSEVYIPSRKYPRTSKTPRSKGLKKGSLRNIMTMPIDIFAQIALYLLPVDIMNLSRTAKSLRGLLTQRSSAHIWRGAAWNVPELPPCPPYLSEPKYFSLIYSKTCSYSDAEVNCVGWPRPAEQRSPGQWMHTCLYAFALLAETTRKYRSTPLLPHDILICRCSIIRAQDLEMHIRVIIPMSFGIVSLHDKTMDYGVYSLRTDVELLEEEHQQLKDAGLLGDESDDYWPEPKRTAFIAREEHSHKLRDFLREMEQLRTMEISEKKRIFRDDVEARLTEMGWEEGDLKFSWRYCREWDMLVNQQRSLTDRIWEGLYPKLEPLLKDNRDRRLADEREERKVERNRAFKKFWLRMGQKCGVYLTERIPNTDVREKVHKFIPPTETVMEWPSLKPILDMDITPEEMKKLVHKDWDKIKRACQEWRSGVEKQLADCLRKDEISREYPALTPYVLVSGSTKRTLSPDLSLLLRADSVFQYRGMRNPRFFPDVIDSTYFVADRANIMSESWRIESYSPYSAAREAAKELLECLGMPNATYLNMKCRGKRFVCGRCHDIFPKSWESMIMHYVEEKRLWENNQDYIENEESCGITFNNIHDADYETDEPLVRLLTVGEAKEYAESAPAWADKPWLRHEEAYVCSVCNLYGQFDLDGVLAHLRDVHEELEPELGEEYEDYDSYLERRAEEMDEDEYSELEDYGSELLDGVIGLFGAYLGLPPFQ